jgi:hypothetical protein
MPRQNQLWRNRKERKEWARRLQSDDPGLEVMHPEAAGIDVGNGSHYVAVRADRDAEPVRRFGCFKQKGDSLNNKKGQPELSPFLQFPDVDTGSVEPGLPALAPYRLSFSAAVRPGDCCPRRTRRARRWRG